MNLKKTDVNYGICSQSSTEIWNLQRVHTINIVYIINNFYFFETARKQTTLCYI